LNEEFLKMPADRKLSYLVDNLHSLPDDLAEVGVEILAGAGETEYAVILAREKGMIEKAISVLVGSGDYLWAALIARNAGLQEESGRLYWEGLRYYMENKMYGRAISAATALGLPPDEIDALYLKGIEVESRGMDISRSREMIASAMGSLEIALIGRDDELSLQVGKAIREEMEKNAAEKLAAGEKSAEKWPVEK
jgi:hypothetical protein